MTLFEVTDADGAVTLIECESHCLSADSGGPIVHDFTGIKRMVATASVRSAFDDRVPQPVSPPQPEGALRFVAPQSVREVPA